MPPVTRQTTAWNNEECFRDTCSAFARAFFSEYNWVPISRIAPGAGVYLSGFEKHPFTHFVLCRWCVPRSTGGPLVQDTNCGIKQHKKEVKILATKWWGRRADTSCPSPKCSHITLACPGFFLVGANWGLSGKNDQKQADLSWFSQFCRGLSPQSPLLDMPLHNKFKIIFSWWIDHTCNKSSILVCIHLNRRCGTPKVQKTGLQQVHWRIDWDNWDVPKVLQKGKSQGHLKGMMWKWRHVQPMVCTFF